MQKLDSLWLRMLRFCEQCLTPILESLCLPVHSLPAWSLYAYLCTISQIGAFVLTCAQSPRLEPLCLPVHNLPDCKFDGFIMPKYSHRNWEPYHTHFQMLLICNASVLIAESLSQVCACGCCSCCLPAKGGVGVVLVNWPQFLFYFLNERIPFKILERW